MLAVLWSVPSRGADLGLAATSSLSERFPEGSIKTRADAEVAILASARERAIQETRYAAARAECSRQFLAERCLATAREVNHDAKQKIGAVELSARAYKRLDDARVVDERRTARELSRRAENPPRIRIQERERSALVEKGSMPVRARRDLDTGGPDQVQRALAQIERKERRMANRARKDAEQQAKVPERKERARKHAADVEETLRRAGEKEAKTANKRKQNPIQLKNEPTEQVPPAALRMPAAVLPR